MWDIYSSSTDSIDMAWCAKTRRWTGNRDNSQSAEILPTSRLRFEPYSNYEDLEPLVSHLSTFAADAYEPDSLLIRSRKSSWKIAGEYLGLTMAESNPLKTIKPSKKPLGNLPLEIFTYLSAYVQSIISNGTLPTGAHQSMAMASLSSLNEVLTGTERVLNTPLP